MVSSSYLERMIQKEPLTKDGFVDYLGKVDELRIIEKPLLYNTGLISSIEFPKWILKVSIEKYQSQEEKEITLVHELAHAFYLAIKLDDIFHDKDENTKNKKEVEDLIETESQRFYKENKEFVKELYQKHLIKE